MNGGIILGEPQLVEFEGYPDFSPRRRRAERARGAGISDVEIVFDKRKMHIQEGVVGDVIRSDKVVDDTRLLEHQGAFGRELLISVRFLMVEQFNPTVVSRIDGSDHRRLVRPHLLTEGVHEIIHLPAGIDADSLDGAICESDAHYNFLGWGQLRCWRQLKLALDG